MSRSKKKSISMPHPLCDVLEDQLNKKVIDYPSFNAALTGMALYQGLTGKDHAVTSQIAYMHPDVQDAVHDFTKELNERNLSVLGSFIRRVAERVAQGETEPDPDTIIKLQAKQIVEWSIRWQHRDETVWEEIAVNQQGK